MNKGTKGISLIVLVITIIVMIIIAGSIILSLSNTNVIAKAKEGRAKNEISLLKEQWTRAYGEALMDAGGMTPTEGAVQEKFGVSNIPTGYLVKLTGLQYTGSDTAIISAATALGVEVPDITLPTLGTLTSTQTQTSITVTITGATDVGSGIKNYDFYLNGNFILTQTSNIYSYTSLTAGTTYTIKYIVRDNYDNIRTSSNISIQTVAAADTTSPTLGTLSSYVYNKNIDVTITGATDASGIKNYDFYLNGVKVVTQVSNFYAYVVPLYATNYTIKYVVRDNYDNISTSANIVIRSAARRWRRFIIIEQKHIVIFRKSI